ncbi:MAG: hypothetical protein C4584_01575 [Armatimonadetes bacterium]|nr:MAG: hypothetical protein C4584_01575 [Armatimonadota bacterium]
MRYLIVVSLLFFLFLTLLGQIALAESTQELDAKRADIQRQIAELEQQLQQVRGEKKTLQSQLTFIDTQTKLTRLKIEETTTQVNKLEKEIDKLTTRIDRLSETVDSITQVLLVRITQTYKFGNFSTIDLLFSSHGFTDLLERMKYLQVAQSNDKKVLYQLQATKATYNDQKVDKESRQKEQEKLKKDLENYQLQLSNQKKDREELLEVTKNKEANYQSLIKQLEADRDSILKAISNIGAVVGEVSRGQQIAREGNTGCVYPPPPGGFHLHFEVYKDAKVEGAKVVDVNSGEPIQFRSSNHLQNPRPYLDSGQLQKPTDGYPGNITAEFGYSDNYRLNSGYHTGLDMADPPGSPIFAAEKGTAYSTGGSACDAALNYAAGTTLPAKGVIIDHHNGLVTLYWHIL